MPQRTRWFDRRFAFDLPDAMLANVIERLRGTPARLEERLAPLGGAALTAKPGGSWSIQENAGHLGDLEPLWIRRARQVIEGAAELEVADLSNGPTDRADHNARPLADILRGFRESRAQLVAMLNAADDDARSRSALHPRLRTPMRLVDIAFFTAEHDDHHLARITEILSARR
jgi:uncharacterized damage-inducible protein DinB